MVYSSFMTMPGELWDKEEIARQLNMTPSAVHGWLQRLQSCGRTIPVTGKAGRRNLYSASTIRSAWADTLRRRRIRESIYYLF
jgi:predicted transcriptional regulator